MYPVEISVDKAEQSALITHFQLSLDFSIIH